MRRKHLSVLSFVLIASMILSGCGGAASPESISISYDGKAAEKLEFLVGTDDIVLTAVTSPEDFSGTVTWESDDAGVVKVVSTDGKTCTVSVRKTGTVRLTATAGDVKTSVKIFALKNQDKLSSREVAMTVDGVDYSSEKLILFYAEQYYAFLRAYGSSVMYVGLDPTKDFHGLDKISCYGFDSEHYTWQEYFLDKAAEQLIQVHVLNEKAAEEGVKLEEEDLKRIDKSLQETEKVAKEKGYSNLNEYFAMLYGKDMNEKLMRSHLERTALAKKMCISYKDSLVYSDEELSKHFKELGYTSANDYTTRNVRIILIEPEKDEDGTVSDEAKEKAANRAQEIYDKWMAGEATEESFAAFADEYSADTSSEDGGLYKNVHKGTLLSELNDFTYGQRKPGDCEVISVSTDTFSGSFVIYYCGEGDRFSVDVPASDLKSTALNEWLDSLIEECSVEYGEAYESVGID